MAAITGIRFDKASYVPGDDIIATVDFTPDTPSIVPQSYTLTANIRDANGNVLTSSQQEYVVERTQPGDSADVTDSGGRQWLPGTVLAAEAGRMTAEFHAVA